jgi:sugar phosphate isomerase/epimerase
MVKDWYIRVDCERLAEQAPLLKRLRAKPEVCFKARTLRQFKPKNVRDLARLLADFSSHTLHAPFMDVWPGAADDEIRRLSLDLMQRTMDLAASLKSRLVVMHFNFDPIYYSEHFRQWLQRAAEFYRTLLREEDGPLIALENIAEPTPYIALQLFRAVDHPRLVHCFDFGHHHVFARIPMEEWLFYLAPRRHIHFHLHDNDGGSDEHLAMGQGRIDWTAAKAALRGLNCPFSITLEPHTDEILRLSAAYFKKNFL